jgi:hypothetical protein
MPGNKPQAGLTTADLVGLAQESMRLLTPCGESIAPLLMNGHREMTDTPKPTEISLHQKSRVLEIAFEDGARFELPYEFRMSPSPRSTRSAITPSSRILTTATTPASTPGRRCTTWAETALPTGRTTLPGWKRQATSAGKAGTDSALAIAAGFHH